MSDQLWIFKREQSGFTLVEMMVVVAVLAILAAIAVPSFTSLINRGRVVAGSNEVVGALQAARMEAIRTNRRVVFCRSTDGQTCAGATGSWGRWVVGEDTNSDGQVDTLFRTGEFNPALSVLNSDGIDNSTVMFNPSGFAADDSGNLLAVSLQVCMVTTRPRDNARRVHIVGGSRISTSEAESEACDAPEDTEE